jgi:carboxypeptidase D
MRLIAVLFLVASLVDALQLPLNHNHRNHRNQGKLPKEKEFEVGKLPTLDMTKAHDGFKHWAGMMPIDDGHNGHLFFWFFKARVNSTKLVIWINGGPGCSSMLGLLAGHAPLRLKPEGGLAWNNHSWTQHANVLCTFFCGETNSKDVDQPVMTGYSYTEGRNTMPPTVHQVAEEFVRFMDNFYSVFSWTQKMELFAAGESYAGVWLPWIARYMLDANDKNGIYHKKPAKHQFPLKALAIGNGVINPLVMYQSNLEYGVVNKMFEAGSTWEKQIVELTKKCERRFAMEGEHYQYEECDAIEDVIVKPPSIKNGTLGMCYIANDIRKLEKCKNADVYPPEMTHSEDFLNNKKVMKALNVLNAPHKAWKWCRGHTFDQLTYDPSAPSYRQFAWLTSRINILMYNGDKDMQCNYIGYEWTAGNLTWNRQTGWTGKSSTRLDYTLPASRVAAGYMHGRDNLTYLRVFDGGHVRLFWWT